MDGTYSQTERHTFFCFWSHFQHDRKHTQRTNHWPSWPLQYPCGLRAISGKAMCFDRQPNWLAPGWRWCVLSSSPVNNTVSITTAGNGNTYVCHCASIASCEQPVLQFLETYSYDSSCLVLETSQQTPGYPSIRMYCSCKEPGPRRCRVWKTAQKYGLEMQKLVSSFGPPQPISAIQSGTLALGSQQTIAWVIFQRSPSGFHSPKTRELHENLQSR